MPAPKLHTYAAHEMKIIFKGIEVRGIKKGSFIKIKRKVDDWSEPVVSADGTDATRTQMVDESGEVEITLEPGSETNKKFNQILKSDRVNKDGVGTFSCRDLNGNDKHTSEKAYLAGPPAAGYGDQAADDKVWKIYCVSLQTDSEGSFDE